MLSKARSLLVVSSEERGLAYGLLLEYFTLRTLKRRYTVLELVLKGELPRKRTFTESEIRAALDYLRERIKAYAIDELERAIEDIGRDAARTYLHCLFAHATRLIPDKALVALVVDPPQITVPDFGMFITPRSYIETHFIPTRTGKIHYRSIIAKYFFTLVKVGRFLGLNRKLFDEILSKCTPIRVVFEENTAKYMQHGKTRVHAENLAFRDVVRIVIGCMWLTWTYAALSAGIVRRVVLPKLAYLTTHRLVEPHEVILCHEDEELINSMLEQCGVKRGLEEITWNNLKTLAKTKNALVEV